MAVVSKPFRPLRWIGLWCADVLCGFGDSLWKVAAWLVVLAALPGVIYAILGDVVHGSGGLGDDFLVSVSQLTASTPQRLSSGSAPLLTHYRHPCRTVTSASASAITVVAPCRARRE